jgi:phage tail-like protein
VSAGTWLAPRGHGGPPSRVPGDYRYLEDVVRIAYPVKDARTYLNRHLGNSVRYKLVESRRGETIGLVREVEVEPVDGGEIVSVRPSRTLPDGSPASFFAPAEMVEIRALVETATDGPIPPLNPHDTIILHVPVRSYLRFLPGLYQGAVPTRRRDVAQTTERSARQWGARDQERTTTVEVHHADQFRRFLFLFQHMMTTVTERIDGIPSLTDPMTSDPRFLPWISSWVGFELDESLPLHQQRELVRRSIRLYRTRGTRRGVEEMIMVLTATEVRIEERKKPAGLTMGTMRLAGGRSIEDRYLRGEPTACYSVRPERKATTFFAVVLEHREAFQKRFGERAPAVLRRISQVVTNEKPAHVTFTIEFDESVR